MKLVHLPDGNWVLPLVIRVEDMDVVVVHPTYPKNPDRMVTAYFATSNIRCDSKARAIQLRDELAARANE